MPKEKTQLVTIPLDEYKMLLLKEQPSNNLNGVLNRLFDSLKNCIEYTDSTYYNTYIGDNMKIKECDGLIANFFRELKYADIDTYMEIWNKVMTNKRKKDEMDAKVKQMNDAKDIRNGD